MLMADWLRWGMADAAPSELAFSDLMAAVGEVLLRWGYLELEMLKKLEANREGSMPRASPLQRWRVAAVRSSSDVSPMDRRDRACGPDQEPAGSRTDWRSRPTRGRCPSRRLSGLGRGTPRDQTRRPYRHGAAPRCPPATSMPRTRRSAPGASGDLIPLRCGFQRCLSARLIRVLGGPDLLGSGGRISEGFLSRPPNRSRRA